MTSTTIWRDLIQNFLIGGFIVTSVSYIGTFMSPLLGAIWWSFPLSLLPSIYFMHQQNKNNQYISEFALSTTFALLLLFISTYALSYFIKHEPNNEIFYPILKTAAVWIVLSIVFYLIVERFGLTKYFM